MIDVDDLKEAILEMANEDWYGLYEVIWHMNKVQPDIPQATKIEAARSAIYSLLRAGQIHLGLLEWPKGGPPVSLPDSDIPALLDDPNSWEPAQRYVVLWSDK